MQLSKRTQMHLSRIIDTAYYLLILVAFYLFMRYAFWMVFPFLFSLLVAIVLQKPMNYAHQKIRLKKSFTAVSLVLLFYLLVVVLVALIGIRIWNAARGSVDYLMAQVKNLPALIEALRRRLSDLLKFLPDSAEARIDEWITAFINSLIHGQNAAGEPLGTFESLISKIDLQWFKAPVTGMLSTAGKIPSIVVAAVITIISSFFITISYESIVGFIKHQLRPSQRSALSATKRIMFHSMGKLLRSYVIIMAVTFVELALGLFLLRLIGVYEGGGILSVSFIMAVVDIFPVLGTAMILIPWALYCLIMGEIGMAVGLLILLGVITVVRQIIEPKIIASNLGLPPIVTIAGMYIGLQVFGFVGVFMVPVLIILLKMLNDEGVLHIWKPMEKTEAPPPAKPMAKLAAKFQKQKTPASQNTQDTQPPQAS